MGPLKLAWKYICFHRFKSIVLIASIFLTLFLPIAIELLLTQFENQIVARANSTPLVIGPAGSRFDLTLRSLYFRNNRTEESQVEVISYGETTEINESGLANAIPLYSKFSASSYPVVGTSPEYFTFRDLWVGSGNGLVRIGDCVLGYKVANELELAAGDSIMTDPASKLSITSYPMKLTIRGVLGPSHSPDDNAIFVDLKTAWIIEGIGHGHQNVGEVDDEKLLSKTADKVVASSAVLPYTEITDENISSFHFHGNEAEFPISAVIAIPKDEKGETILIGRYRNAKNGQQLVKPRGVIAELMSFVFQIKRFFDANAILIAVSTFLLLCMIVSLSIKLRTQEIETMFKIGAGKITIASLLFFEIFLIGSIAVLMVTIASALLSYFSTELIQSLLQI